MTTDVKILGFGIIIIIIGTMFSIAYVNNLTQEYHIRYEQNKPKACQHPYTYQYCDLNMSTLDTLLPTILKSFISTNNHTIYSWSETSDCLEWVIRNTYGEGVYINVEYLNTTGYYSISYFKLGWDWQYINGYLW